MMAAGPAAVAADAPAPATRGRAFASLQDGEVILFETRVSWRWSLGVALMSQPVIWGAVAAMVLVGLPDRVAAGSLAIWTVLSVVLPWTPTAMNRFIMTDLRVVRSTVDGVEEISLPAIRRVVVTRPWHGVLTGTGRLAFFDHDGREAVRWWGIAHPRRVRDRVCEAIRLYARGDFEDRPGDDGAEDGDEGRR